MSLNRFDLDEPEGDPADLSEVQDTHFKPSYPSGEPEPLKMPMQLFLEEINEFPLLTASLERKIAELKDKAGPFFQEQAAMLERAILDCLTRDHAGRQAIVEALDKIKNLILQREGAMVSGQQTRGEALPIPERDGLADAAFRRMVHSSRNKRTFDLMLEESDVLTDEVFTRNLFAVMQKHVGLCQRVVTSNIEEVAALASITRESFAFLRGALPAGHPALQSLAERDAAFEAEVTDDEECREYIAPLLQQRSLTSVGVMTPQDILMRANLRLVVRIARGYMRKGLELPDLIEEGNLGLYRAIEAFKTSKSVRFSTYASYWIKQSIKRGLINQGHEVRLPMDVTGLASKWRQASKCLHEQLGREPSEEEIRVEIQLPEKKLKIVREALKFLNAQFQRDGDPDEAGEMSVAEMVEGHDPSAPDQLVEADENDLIETLVEKLNPRAAQVIRLRFPQDGSEPKTLLEIGEMLGLTRERIRQIESEALQTLRNAARDDVEDEDEILREPVGIGRRGRPPKIALPVGELHSMPAGELPLDSHEIEEAREVRNNGAMSRKPHTEFPGDSSTPENGSARKFTVSDDVIGYIADHLDEILGNIVVPLNRLGAVGGSIETTRQEPVQRQAAAPPPRLTEEDNRVPSPSFTPTSMPRQAPNAESKRQNLSPEEKSTQRGSARQEHRPLTREQSEVQEEVLAQEVQLTEAYRRKLAEALKVSLVRNSEGKMVFRIAQTDIEPV